MAVVEVTLDQDEIIEACRYWATHRVLNVGEALSAEVHVPENHEGSLLAKVWVKTEYMKKEEASK